MSQERKQTKKCTQEGSLLHQVMITSTEETFQSFSHENDSVSINALHYLDRSSETKDVWSNTPENTELTSVPAAQDVCEAEPSALGTSSEGHGSDPEEKSHSCHLIEGDKNDGSRKFPANTERCSRSFSLETPIRVCVRI